MNGMQFTPQQLVGGHKYIEAVKIGNWVEDRCLQDTKLKDYLRRKEDGQLLVLAKQKRLATCLQEAPLALHFNCVNFDAPLMIASHGTRSFLSTVPYEGVSYGTNGRPAFQCYTAANPNPTARSTFTLKRVNPGRDGHAYSSNVLHYNQKFRILSNPMSHPDEKNFKHFYLCSLSASHLATARIHEGKQVVYFSADPTGDTLWEVVHSDPKQRFESEGAPLSSNSPFVLRHVTTGAFLAATSSAKVITDFGNECEVFAKAHINHHRHHLCVSELAGAVTVDDSLRTQSVVNIWSFFGSEEHENAPAGVNPSSNDEINNVLNSKIIEHPSACELNYYRPNGSIVASDGNKASSYYASSLSGATLSGVAPSPPPALNYEPFNPRAEDLARSVVEDELKRSMLLLDEQRRAKNTDLQRKAYEQVVQANYAGKRAPTEDNRGILPGTVSPLVGQQSELQHMHEFQIGRPGTYSFEGKLNSTSSKVKNSALAPLDQLNVNKFVFN